MFLLSGAFVNSGQIRLAASLIGAVIVVAMWLYSFHTLPGGGALRTTLMFGVLYLLLSPYDADFRAVAREHPIDPNVIGGVFAGWLFVLLAALLVAYDQGYEFPTRRGVNRPLSVIIFTLPLIGVVLLRFWQIYLRLARGRA